MAITINWGTKVISVPQADLTLVSPNNYNLDLDVFRNRLNDLQDDEQGITYDRVYVYTAPSTLGGVTYAAVVRIINGYTVTFEDGQYAVNLVGGNSNVGDVVNLNQVSVRSNNSAGLVSLSELLLSLEIINQGIQNSSLVIPHTVDLP